MPSDKAPGASKTSKRVRTESARKREGRENAEALKCDRAELKAASKARKDLRDEAADDDLLVEREGESPEFSKLRVFALRLESDNQRMKAKLARRDEQDDAPPLKVIPPPANKGDADVELLRHHLDLLGDEHDVEWSMIRHDFRGLLVAGGLNWDKPWSKQDPDRVNTLFHAAESRRPEMKRFSNHWGTEFLLKECFANIYGYHHKQAKQQPDSNSRSAKGDARRDVDPHTDTRDSDNDSDIARRAAAHKAAAHRAAERKAGKRKADTQENDEPDSRQDEDAVPDNDGETEIEELPDETRQAVERDEIGVPSKSKLPAKATAKLNRTHPKDPEAVPSSMPLPKARMDPPSRASGSGSKPRAVVYLKRGRGGKVRQVGGGGRGHVPDADMSSAASSPDDDDAVSSSSGQTTSGSEED